MRKTSYTPTEAEELKAWTEQRTYFHGRRHQGDRGRSLA
eukprot:CAMPEP_0194520760 /NCGR_PEP_ID=MMETSP0253-20130528/54867_1 /TAXON_ID=2966 /ORGANISM="Noctiluca scintillans" /LENGTH=38 /DNA_ID= /DNA_START= /DNA_END= /DNA_ORIENTATION=